MPISLKGRDFLTLKDFTPRRDCLSSGAVRGSQAQEEDGDQRRSAGRKEHCLNL